ncbi:MAG: hypothetical protein WBA74_03410 [Cyclobacteriaceae bacterium]
MKTKRLSLDDFKKTSTSTDKLSYAKGGQMRNSGCVPLSTEDKCHPAAN